MNAQRKLVAFFGLGTRTATTLVYEYLRQHPEAVIPSKETNFFSDAKEYAKGITWYEGHFSPSQIKSRCGELASDYLTSAQAAALIATVYPSARLLAVVENPLLVVRIEYVEAIRSGRVQKSQTLAQFLKLYPEQLLRAKFGRQLANYFSYYSGRDFLVLVASDVRADQLAAVRSVYEHCGLDPTFVPLGLKHLVVEEEDDGKKRPGLIKRTFKLIKRFVKYIYTKIAQKIKPPKVVAETAVEQAQRIPLSPELTQYLRDYFRADVEQLSALLHRNFNVEWEI